ncbi:MAG: HdaA/DnaA family protein [Methylophilaceae bacterium]
MKQLLLDIKPVAAPTLQNFVAGRNAEALSNLKSTIEIKNHFIYFWGETGSGKSHLLSACEAGGIRIADDVHLLDDKAQVALFNTYNQLKENGEILVAAGAHAPNQMDLRNDLATRLAWDLVYQLHPLNDAEKAQALKNHAKERGIKLPDEVIDYCLRYMRRDLPTLMATLDALDDWSLTMHKPVTVPMLKQLLQLDLGI